MPWKEPRIRPNYAAYAGIDGRGWTSEAAGVANTCLAYFDRRYLYCGGDLQMSALPLLFHAASNSPLNLPEPVSVKPSATSASTEGFDQKIKSSTFHGV